MSLFQLMSVSASGMSAQRMRAELLVENLANAETTRTAEGGPYRRRDAVFSASPRAGAFASVFDEAAGPFSTGVEVSEVMVDAREPEKRFIPGHPDADADGYVAFPNVNPAEDMVNLMGASKGYQANVSAMTAVKDMIHRSLDLLR
jgi:flagellar basal-body rod protein FlgC